MSMRRAEDLIMLAAAKGTDLKRVAGGSAPDSGPSVRKRRLTKDERKDANGRPIYETVKGSQTRVAIHPEWSHAELGMAAAQLEALAWLAAQYHVAGDETEHTYWSLYRGLRERALEFERAHRWPHTVMGSDGQPRLYLESIVQLVLDEDRNRRFFEEEPRLYGWYLHVEEPVWKFKLLERFELVKFYFQSLYGRAQGHIGRAASEEIEVIDEAS